MTEREYFKQKMNNEFEVLNKLIEKLNEGKMNEWEDTTTMEYVMAMAVYLIGRGDLQEIRRMQDCIAGIKAKGWDEFIGYTTELLQTPFEPTEKLIEDVREIVEKRWKGTGASERFRIWMERKRQRD